MIVNYKQTGWEVITQRAHGLVAAQVAMHWKMKERPERWLETIMAIAEHDDAEVELDGENLLTEAGGPLHFAMKGFDLQHCREMAMLTITKSRYIALLVSMHLEFLHRKHEDECLEAREFLQEQRKLQEQLREQLGLDKTEVDRIYYLLEWCDAFSLIVCQQQMQPEKRGIEISTGPDGQVYQLFELEPGLLTVEPWPFETETFTVWFESREINQLKFDSSAAFREAFLKATPKDNTWRITNIKGKIEKPAKV